MKTAGITAEYNPLHNGHVYHMDETRKSTSCDALVVAMSGDFVQRGEPAILDKWIRAEHALKAGADLVVEIPTLFCLGNASQYASASVRLLESLGCRDISFGSESGDIDTIKAVSGFIAENRSDIDSLISGRKRDGKSYPAARSDAYREMREGAVSDDMLDKELSVLSSSNDILAIEYIINMKDSCPLAIKRRGADHNSGAEVDGAEFQSAEHLRRVIRSEGAASLELHGNVPYHVFASFVTSGPVFPDDCFDLLRYAVLSTDASPIDECPSGGEGLGNLMKSVINDAKDYDDLILRMKSKRYTYTRLSRLCMQLLLGIRRDAYDFSGPGYIRVLGMNDTGRAVLAGVRKSSELPLITNINREKGKLDEKARKQLELDIHASEIYRLITHCGAPEQRIRPVVVKKKSQVIACDSGRGDEI